DLHGVNRLDPAREILEIVHRLRLGQADVDLRLWGRSAEGICGRLRATGDEDRYKDHLSVAHVRSLDSLTSPWTLAGRASDGPGIRRLRVRLTPHLFIRQYSRRLRV